MKPILFLSYKRQIRGVVEQGITAFLGEAEVSSDRLDSNIAGQLKGSPPLDFVHFVGFQTQIATLRAAIGQAGSLLKDRLAAVAPPGGLRFFEFDEVGGLHRCVDVQGALVDDSDEQISAERRYSLLRLFQSAGGEERAPKGTHYAKTSTSHSDRFLRVSNVLEDGLHVAVVAFWVLPLLWKRAFHHLVVDTSSIYSVAFKAIHEATKRGGLIKAPTVWSHRSHDGVEDIPEHVAKEAIFLVSASTSNSLVKKLEARGADSARVRTLFSLAQDADGKHEALCDLSATGEGSERLGIATIDNHQSGSCPLCKEHHHLIRIQGDQFSIAPPRVTAVDLLKADVPSSLRPVLTALCGLRSFFAYRRFNEEQVCTLGMEVTPLLVGDLPQKAQDELLKLRSRWDGALRRAMNLSLRNVVACSYPGSSVLAEQVLDLARGALANQAQVDVVLSHELAARSPVAATSTAVISACVAQPHELLSVSRALRGVQEGGSITYLSVVQLISPKESVERLKKTLTMGQHGPGTFTYATALELPFDSFEDRPSWSLELDELRRLRSWLDEKERDVPREIEARIDRLDQAPALGLVDDLFWTAPSGAVLALRSDFTLADRTLEDPKASQADLFAIINIALTGLRQHGDDKRRLVQNAYERNVLSPANFSRYNDGVLQACILRAARPAELAYGACDGPLSEEMLHILLDCVVEQLQGERSESMREFLVAMMIGRLTLLPEHLKKLLGRLVEATAENSVERVMAEYLQYRSA